MKNTYQPEDLALYFSPLCPFCHRVLNAMAQLGLEPNLSTRDAKGIALKNTDSDRKAAEELRNGGGKSTVPCLRINSDGKVKWLYESLDIIHFLKTKVNL